MAHLVPHHDDSASSSTASCSASVPYLHYDIFINLCEYNCSSRDVDTFAAILRSAFENLNLHVFVDNPNLRESHNKIPPAIENAILASSVHITILPPNFAKSTCCLDELVLMIKSSAESKTTTLPVFYYAKPSWLRRTGEGNDGPYAQALCNYEKENLYGKETIKQWRDALKHVAELSGFVVDENHWNEDELLAKIVETVKENLAKRFEVIRSSDLQNALKSVLKGNDVKPADRETAVTIQAVRQAVRRAATQGPVPSTIKEIELKETIKDYQGRVMNAVRVVKGVDSVAVDMQITVMGHADPEAVRMRLEQFGHTELLSVGPASFCISLK